MLRRSDGRSFCRNSDGICRHDGGVDELATNGAAKGLGIDYINRTNDRRIRGNSLRSGTHFHTGCRGRRNSRTARYNLGIRVDQVQLKNVNPPSQVQASFNEVNKAQQDRENAINIANGEYNKVVPKAKGEADQTIRAAEGYRFKRVNEAEGDVAAFSSVLLQYIKAPEITRTRLYLETMSEILPQTGQKTIIDESLRQLLPVLPLSTKPREGKQ